MTTSSKQRSLVIALTGGIASGKTAVSDAFAALGVPVVDTDVIARQVVAPGSAGLAEVVATFGDTLLTAAGDLDRAKLRERIFADADARQQLERLLHPRIMNEAQLQLARVLAPYALLVVPLLVESGLFAGVDRVLVVDVPESVQIERLLARDGGSPDAAASTLRAQASRTERLERADDVLDNTGSLDALHAAVTALHQQYLQLASARRRD
ncbi:MAG: dephospho-CoA kinase [Pseudomonadota bacterium]